MGSFAITLIHSHSVTTDDDADADDDDDGILPIATDEFLHRDKSAFIREQTALLILSLRLYIFSAVPPPPPLTTRQTCSRIGYSNCH